MSAKLSFSVNILFKSTTSIGAVLIETDFPYSLHKNLGTPKNRKDVTVFDFSLFDTHTAPLLEARIAQRLRRQLFGCKKGIDRNSFLCDPLIEVKFFRKKPIKALTIEESSY